MSATAHAARPGGLPQTQLIYAQPGEDPSGFRARVRAVAAAAPGRFTSRSYRFPVALVAWHDAPVGVDIERVEPCPPGFAASISTPSELGRTTGPDSNKAQDMISLWCSKEALAKALGDALRYDPRRLESPLAWPDGRSGPWCAGALDAPDGHVAWLCWREPELARP
jgi:hypothetical protein